MYTTMNFKTKKALKEAVAAGRSIGVYQPNSDLTGFGPTTTANIKCSVEGPHYPLPHRWYATVWTDENGDIRKVM